jgi:enterochelin esterase-like enzyme
MGLTSHQLLALAVLVAVAAVVGTVWFWPRLARPTWPAVLGRLGTVLATQLGLLAVLLLVANDYFSFYSSWSDLLGTARTGPVTVNPGGASSAPPSAGRAQTLATEAFQGGAPEQSGQLQTVRIGGARSGLSTDGYVYLPPEYFQPAHAQQRFPALIVLTGFPGDAKNLVTRLDYPGISLGLDRAGRVHPTVLVMLRPSPAMPQDTECEDIPGGAQSDTYFTRDVPQAVAAAYRVGTDARAWGMIGDSTGGYCALKLAMRHPETFPAAVSLSGYYRAAEDPTTGDLFKGSQQRRDEADLLWRLRNLPPPRAAVLLAGTRDDTAYVRDTDAFTGAVRAPMTVATGWLDHGGHNFQTWTRLEPAALEWLSQNLDPPG